MLDENKILKLYNKLTNKLNLRVKNKPYFEDYEQIDTDYHKEELKQLILYTKINLLKDILEIKD